MRRKTSVIWTTPHEDLQKLLDESFSIVDILKSLGFNGYNGNHRTLTQRINDGSFDLTQFNSNKEKYRSEKIKNAQLRNYKRDEDIFVENSTYVGNSGIKLRMVKMGIPYKCSECELGLYYNNKPISLQLDHINGINTDNRIDNLRFLCPNCHSQTETFSGKRNKTNMTPIHNLLLNIPKVRKKVIRKPKIDWPSKETLEKLLWKKPTVSIAKDLNVSDKAVEKHIKKLGLSKPPRGYWTKMIRQQGSAP